MFRAATPIALVGAVVLHCSPAVWAEPAGDAVQPDVVADACTQFSEALNLAARSYDEFAYATAGNGDEVNYSDERVWRSNLVGRTALRESAHSALSTSRAPGLPPEVSDPIRSWSLSATKLLVVMGLRRGGDALNAAANDLNAHAQDAQTACALHGARS